MLYDLLSHKDVVYLMVLIIYIVIVVLLTVAFATVIERKILAASQMRKGPNRIGTMGALQPFADALKLLSKQSIFPNRANIYLYYTSPMVVFGLSLFGWSIVSLEEGTVLADINLGIVYFLVASSLNIYGLIGAGWSSNSRYAFLGALRSCAQMLSYELVLSVILVDIFVCCGSLNITELVQAQIYIWYGVALFPLFIVFFIAALAETNRPPFDLPEAEAELVAGYNVEYAALAFAYFFLAEYSYILLMSNMMVILFWGGWLPPFSFLGFIPGYIWYAIKVYFMLVCFVWARTTLPRFRYDQLMSFGWKILLPMTFGWVVVGISVLIFFDGLPPSFYGKI
jgi:NADH-quinone oxidoreductase subunit H